MRRSWSSATSAAAVALKPGSCLVPTQVRRQRGHVAAGDLDHAQFFAVQLQCGELAAPDRAGVDGVHALGDAQASYQGYRPAAWVPGGPFSSIAMRPRGVQ